MTKKELKQLIKECVSEIILSDAIITKGKDHNLSYKEISKNVIDKFKTFYSNPNTFNKLHDYLYKNAKSFKSYYKNLNYKTQIAIADLSVIADFLNENFFDKLVIGGMWRYWDDPNFQSNKQKDTKYFDQFLKGGDSPVPIKMEDIPIGDGAYSVPKGSDNFKTGYIALNIKRTILKYDKTNDDAFSMSYNLIKPEDVDYNELEKTIEHELIHFEQHRRSNKSALTVLGDNPAQGKNIDPEMKYMINNIPNDIEKLYKSEMDYNDDWYVNQLNYFNKKAELMPHAKNTIQKYEQVLKQKYPNQPISKEIIEKEPINKYVLSLFPQYRFLTPSNKKKYLNYLYQYTRNM